MADTAVRSLDELVAALVALRAAHPEIGSKPAFYDNVEADWMRPITRVDIYGGHASVAS